MTATSFVASCYNITVSVGNSKAKAFLDLINPKMGTALHVRVCNHDLSQLLTFTPMSFTQLDLTKILVPELCARYLSKLGVLGTGLESGLTNQTAAASCTCHVIEQSRQRWLIPSVTVLQCLSH